MTKEQKRYHCSYAGCERTFSTSGHLSRHSKIHTGEKPHICPILFCESRFSRKDNMMQHFNSHKRKIPEAELAFKPSEVPETSRDENQYNGTLNSLRMKPAIAPLSLEFKPAGNYTSSQVELSSPSFHNSYRVLSPDFISRAGSVDTTKYDSPSNDLNNFNYDAPTYTPYCYRPSENGNSEWPYSPASPYPSASSALDGLYEFQKHARTQSQPITSHDYGNEGISRANCTLIGNDYSEIRAPRSRSGLSVHLEQKTPYSLLNIIQNNYEDNVGSRTSLHSNEQTSSNIQQPPGFLNDSGMPEKVQFNIPTMIGDFSGQRYSQTTEMNNYTTEKANANDLAQDSNSQYLSISSHEQ